MRNYILILFILICSNAYSAERHWVGGSDTWDATAGSKWSLTNGGTGGEAVPTAADDVFFDSGSGAAVVATSGTSTDLCRSLNFTGFTGTFNHAASTTVNIGDGTQGHFTMVPGMTYTRGSTTTSDFNFVSTTTGNQVTTAGKSLGDVIFNGAGGSWILQDSFTQDIASKVQLENGTLDTNNQTCTWGWFDGVNNTNTRTLTMGSSSVTILDNDSNSFQIQNTNNFTLTAGTWTITFSGTGPDVNIGGTSGAGFSTWNNVIYTGTGGTKIMTYDTGTTFQNLTMPNGGTHTWTSGVTYTFGSPFVGFGNSTTLTFNASSTTAYSFSKPTGDVLGNFLTLTLSTATGGAKWYAYNSQNVRGNTGWIFPTGLYNSTFYNATLY